MPVSRAIGRRLSVSGMSATKLNVPVPAMGSVIVGVAIAVPLYID